MKKTILIVLILFSLNSFCQKQKNFNKIGIEFSKNGKLEEALEAFNKSIENNPNSYAAYANRGNIYRTQKKYDLAIKDYTKSLSLYEDTQVLYLRANTYLEMNDFISAITDYSAIIEKDNHFPDIYFDRGYAFIRLENYKYAKTDFESQLKITPKDFKTIANLAGVKRELKLYDEALADYVTIFRDFPDQKNMYILYNNRASIYYDIQEYQKAYEDVNVALSMNNTYDIGYLTRGQINLKLGNKDEACVDLNQAIQLGVESNKNFKADKDYAELKKACE